MHTRPPLIVALLVPAFAAAQDTTRHSAFFRKSDLVLTGIAVAATAGLSAFDTRVARWTRQPSVQGDSSRHDLIKSVSVVNEMPLTVAAVATYGVGKLAHSRTVADIGLHLTESLVATEAVSEGVRIALGRARPRASPTDSYNFRPGKGWSQFEYRAFPSLHAAVAFATAASLAEEVRIRNPSAAKYATPLLYAAATIPGFTRLYLDQHWASDVLAGSFVGALLGTRMVQHAHGHRIWIDKALLGAISPDPNGGVRIGFAIKR
jgi:membrane-associated phospholipid phosphatase